MSRDILFFKVPGQQILVNQNNVLAVWLDRAFIVINEMLIEYRSEDEALESFNKIKEKLNAE